MNTRTVEFTSSRVPLGSNPDVAAAIVWHVVGEAGRRDLRVKELVLKRHALQLTYGFPEHVVREEDKERYAAVVEQQLREAVAKAGAELRAGAVSRGGIRG